MAIVVPESEAIMGWRFVADPIVRVGVVQAVEGGDGVWWNGFPSSPDALDALMNAEGHCIARVSAWGHVSKGHETIRSSRLRAEWVADASGVLHAFADSEADPVHRIEVAARIYVRNSLVLTDRKKINSRRQTMSDRLTEMLLGLAPVAAMGVG